MRDVAFCKTHNQPLTEYYCNNTTCQQQLCVACIVDEHKEHDLFSILKRKDWVLNTLIKKNEVISENKEAVSKQMSGLNDIKQRITDTSSTALANVENTKVELIEIIHEEDEYFKNIIQQSREDQLQNIRAAYDKSEQYLQTLKNTEGILSQMITKEDDATILKYFSSLSSDNEHSFNISDRIKYETSSFHAGKDKWNTHEQFFLGKVNLHKSEYFHQGMAKEPTEEDIARSALLKKEKTSSGHHLARIWHIMRQSRRYYLLYFFLFTIHLIIPVKPLQDLVFFLLICGIAWEIFFT